MQKDPELGAPAPVGTPPRPSTVCASGLRPRAHGSRGPTGCRAAARESRQPTGLWATARGSREPTGLWATARGSREVNPVSDRPARARTHCSNVRRPVRRQLLGSLDMERRCRARRCRPTRFLLEPRRRWVHSPERAAPPTPTEFRDAGCRRSRRRAGCHRSRGSLASYSSCRSRLGSASRC